MSQENVEVVRRMYEAFHGGDAQGALEWFHPEVVFTSPRLDARTGRGREEVNRLISGWIGTFEDWREEIEEMRDLGTHVYVVAVQRGTGKGSGIEVENRYALLYEVAGDQITGLTLYNDPAQALEAAGLSE